MKFVENYKIEDIKMWEDNPRKNDEAVDKLIPLLKKYGMINPVIIDQHGILRAGHTRIKALKKMGRKTVPTLIVDFKDEAHAIGYSIADNKSTEWAQWDFRGLKEIIEGLESIDFDLEMTGFDKNEIDKIMIYGKMYEDEDDEEHLLKNYEEPEDSEESKKVCPYCGRPL